MASRRYSPCDRRLPASKQSKPHLAAGGHHRSIADSWSLVSTSLAALRDRRDRANQASRRPNPRFCSVAEAAPWPRLQLSRRPGVDNWSEQCPVPSGKEGCANQGRRPACSSPVDKSPIAGPRLTRPPWRGYRSPRRGAVRWVCWTGDIPVAAFLGPWVFARLCMGADRWRGLWRARVANGMMVVGTEATGFAVAAGAAVLVAGGRGEAVLAVVSGCGAA
jgi:hypothetical protein